MPAPYSAGSIFVSVVPSFRNNQRDIEKEYKARGREGAKAFAEEFDKQLSSDLPKATEKAARQSRQQNARAGETAGNEYSSAFRRTLGEGLKKASRDLERLSEDGGKGLKIPVDVDRDKFVNSLNSLIRDISLTEADVKVGADVDGAIADVDRLIGSMRRLRDASSNPEIRMDMGNALGSMEDAVTAARKRAALQAEGPQQPVQRQLGSFDSTARSRVQSALAALPPVDVDANVTPAMAKIIEFRQDAYRLLDDIEADVKIDGDDLLARAEALMTLLEGVIETADPEAEIDASFNAAGALAQLKAWKEAVSPTEIEIEPEMGYFRKRLAEATKAAGQSLPELKLDVDATDAEREMARIRGELMTLSENVKVGMDLEEARDKSRELQRELGALRRQNKVSVEVDVDAARAIVELEAVSRAADDAERDLRRSNGAADDGANSFRAFSGVVLGVAALGPLAIPVIGAIGASLAATGPLALSGAAGLGVFALAASGVSDAVKAMQNVQDNAKKDARAYADGVRNAAQAMRSAQRGVVEAEGRVVDAQKDAIKVQQRLVQAREEARQRLIDLQMELRGGALAERRAIMQLAEAEVAYANAMADPGATRTEREQLLLDLDEQKFRVDEVQLANQRLSETAADASKKGVEGSDQVVQAQEDVAAANQRVADSQVAVSDALESLANAQADYADAVSKTSASQDTLAQSLAKLSPEGRAFAEYLFSLKGYLSDLRAAAQAGILPGVQEWMQSIITLYGPQLQRIVTVLAGAIGDMFEGWAEALQSPTWQAFFDMLESKGPIFIGQIGQVLTNLATGVAALLTAFAPAAEDFGNGLVDMSAKFSTWAEGLSQTAGFREFMDWWERVGPKVLDFFWALVDAVKNLAIALAPYGEDLMGVFTAILDWIGEMDPSTLGAIAVAIVGIVVAFQTLVGLNALIHGFTAVWGLASAAMAVFEGTAIGTTAVLTGIAGIIAIVVAAILLIALGLYLLYQNNEWFRNAVDATWKAIKVAISAVVAWFQNSAMPIIETVVTAIGGFFTWLWEDIIKPSLDALMRVWAVVWSVLQSAWENVGAPIFRMISSAAEMTWAILWPIIELIGLAFKGVWMLIALYWENIGKPIFDAWLGVIVWLWEKVIGPTLRFIMDGFGVLFGFIESAWNTVGKPVFDLIATVLSTLVEVFQGSFDGIQDIWAKLQDVFSAPIVFLIETVLNKGLIAGINWVAGIFTDDDTWIDPIPTDWLPGRAYGGTIPGNSPHKRADDVLIRATSGEYMQQVDAVDYYGVGIMDALNEQLIPREALLAGLQGRAYGGTIDPMWQAAKKRFPNATLNSSYRAGDPGYHGRKQAIDLGELGPATPSGSSGLADMKRWIAHTYPGSTELIYDGEGNTVPDRKNGNTFAYSVAVQQAHMNHVHWAMKSIADMLAGASVTAGAKAEQSIWGKMGDFIDSPIGFLKNIVTEFAGDQLDSGVGEMLLNIPNAFAEGIVDTLTGFLDFGYEEDTAANSVHAANADAHANVRDQVRAVANRYGWGGGAQWDALSKLINSESSWNMNASNPSSSARGLFQKMTSLHGPVEKTAADQAAWGLHYIEERYGSPIGAWDWHKEHGSYGYGGLIGGPLTPYLHDQGGVIDPGWNLIYNATRKPEASLNPTQLENIQRIADGGGGRHPLIGSLTVPYAGKDPYEVIDEIDHWATVADRGGKF